MDEPGLPPPARRGTGLFQQRRGRQFGGETIQGNRLQVARRVQARQEHRQGYCAIGHVALVGHVIDDLYRLCLRVLEQIGGLPGPAGVVQVDGELRSGCRKVQQQGK